MTQPTGTEAREQDARMSADDAMRLIINRIAWGHDDERAAVLDALDLNADDPAERPADDDVETRVRRSQLHGETRRT